MITIVALMVLSMLHPRPPKFVTQGRVYPDCNSAERAFDGCAGQFFYDDPGHWECGEGFKPDGVKVIWTDGPNPVYIPKECRKAQTEDGGKE